MQIPTGRGLWCDESFIIKSENDWREYCRQAKEWGISILHFKVGVSLNSLYPYKELEQYQKIAEQYAIQCIPYIHLIGGSLVTNEEEQLFHVEQEAQVCAKLASIFGSIAPIMMSEWLHRDQWIGKFGTIYRKYAYTFLIYPMIEERYDDMWPYLSMNEWADGFFVQVTMTHFPQSWKNLLQNLLYPEWEQMDFSCQQKQGKHIAPILPCFSLKSLSLQDVTNILQLVWSYGYCGFWDEEYALYASTIQQSPLPRLYTQMDIPVTPLPDISSTFIPNTPLAALLEDTQKVPVLALSSSIPSSSGLDNDSRLTRALPIVDGALASSSAPSTVVKESSPTMTEVHYQILWEGYGIKYNPVRPIYKKWKELVDAGISFCIPCSNEREEEQYGMKFYCQVFSNNYIFVYFPDVEKVLILNT